MKRLVFTFLALIAITPLSEAQASPPEDECPLGSYLPDPPVACVPMSDDGEFCYDPDGSDCCSRNCDWDIWLGFGRCSQNEETHYWEC